MAEQIGFFDSRSLAPAEGAAPPLRVRESRRARRLTLRVLPPYTLELVVPRGTRAADVVAFVHEHRGWIDRARLEIAVRYPVTQDALPERIDLRALNQSWAVRYYHEPRERARVRTLGDVLEVRTRDAEHRGAVAALRAWLCDHAGYHLTPWVFREAERVGHRPTRVQVRLQRTRWGSCSTSGTVSLNAALLFVAPAIVRYLLIHELCHFISLNHSRRFWAAVALHEPDFEALDRQLTQSWADIPQWAHPDARRH
jgi:predicted metal-dependent hydrolase